MNRFVLGCGGAVLMFFGTSVSAQFADNGFKSSKPSVRTDFLTTNIGTAAAPLTVKPCVFPLSPLPAQGDRCNNPPKIYMKSNYWSQNIGNLGAGWSFVMNNETAEDSRDNSGPPDQSLPVSSPGYGVFGFTTIYGSNNFPGDTHERAHLVMDIDGAPQQPQLGAIPFMGLFYSSQGTFTANSAPAKLFTGSTLYPTILRWSQRLWQAQNPQSVNPNVPIGQGQSQPGTINAYLQVIAKWGTTPKFIQIVTYRHWQTGNNNVGNPYPVDSLSKTGIVYDGGWNWPYPQSFFYPGAELIEVSMTYLKNQCGISLPNMAASPNVDLTYTVDLQKLYACPSIKALWKEPMPANTSIPVVTIGWPEEGTGVTGGLWTDVHSMGIYTSSTLPAAAMVETTNTAVPQVDGAGVADIRQLVSRKLDRQIPNGARESTLPLSPCRTAVRRGCSD